MQISHRALCTHE